MVSEEPWRADPKWWLIEDLGENGSSSEEDSSEASSFANDGVQDSDYEEDNLLAAINEVVEVKDGESEDEEIEGGEHESFKEFEDGKNLGNEIVQETPSEQVGVLPHLPMENSKGVGSSCKGIHQGVVDECYSQQVQGKNLFLQQSLSQQGLDKGVVPSKICFVRREASSLLSNGTVSSRNNVVLKELQREEVVSLFEQGRKLGVVCLGNEEEVKDRLMELENRERV